MSAKRLSLDDRCFITNKVMRHKYTPRLHELQAHYYQLACEVYRLAFKESEHILIETLPEGWLPRSNYMTVQFGKETDGLEFDGSFGLQHRYTRLPASIFGENKALPKVSKQRPLPARYERGIAAVFSEDDPVTLKYRELLKRKGALIKEATEDRQTLLANLKRFNTLAQLHREWPEIAEFTAEIAGAEKQLPTVPVEDLNKRFALP